MSDVLNKILAVKVEEVAAGKRAQSLAEIEQMARAQSAPRDFAGALQERSCGLGGHP